jgi:hypothetical protein
MKRPQLVAIDVRNATAVALQIPHGLHRRGRLACAGLAADHDQLGCLTGRQILEQQRTHQVDVDAVERRVVKQAHAARRCDNRSPAPSASAP